MRTAALFGGTEGRQVDIGKVRAPGFAAGIVFLACAVAAQERHAESPGDPAFPWGQPFGEWKVQKSASIVRVVPGESALVKKDDVQIQFSFHRPKKIKSVRTSVLEEAGKKKVVFEGIELEAGQSEAEAALYSVTVYYPSLPLGEELRASLAKLGAKSIPDADQFTVDLPSTVIQVIFSRYREKRYLERIVFSSREFTARRKKDQEMLGKQADQEIKKAVEERQKGLRSGAKPWMMSEVVGSKTLVP